MKRSILLILATALLAFPLAAQVNDTYVIPAAAKARGAHGTNWVTRLSIFNPQQHELTVTAVFLPTGGAQGPTLDIDIPANSIAWSDDILEDAFGLTSGSGALLLATFPEANPGVPNTVIARSFLVTSDTYNDVPEGTYGQTIPGIWTGLQDDQDQITAVAHGITNNADWRTNVGVANLGDCSVTLRVWAYDADGNTVLNGAQYLVPPLGHLQDGLPVQLENGAVEFYVEDPCRSNPDRQAVVFPYTATIDNRSGDSRYQTPVLLASPSLIFSAAAAAKPIDPTTIGAKIGLAAARRAHERAEKLGVARLSRTERGLKISRD